MQIRGTSAHQKSPSSRRAWIEITSTRRGRGQCRSPSSRRAWIEIIHQRKTSRPVCVALLAEGVDRNSFLWPITVTGIVALLAEGVDRNLQAEQSFRAEAQVALLAEGVDRNSIDQAAIIRMTSRPPRGGRG